MIKVLDKWRYCECVDCYAKLEYEPSDLLEEKDFYFNNINSIIKYIECPVCGNYIFISRN